MSVLDTMYVEE
jgi:hypothetical protein